MELLQPYFAAPDFNYESARKASGNVAGLCNWAEAMCTYHEVAKVVEPKIAKLRDAEAELKVATKEKNAAEERMAKVQAKLDEMQAQFDAAMAQKQALEDDAAATQKKMDSATALINALAGEEARWTAQSKEFDSQIQRLTGDCALASAFVSYLGPFNKEFRELLMNRDFYGDCMKLTIPVTPNMQVGSGLWAGGWVGLRMLAPSQLAAFADLLGLSPLLPAFVLEATSLSVHPPPWIPTAGHQVPGG